MLKLCFLLILVFAVGCGKAPEMPGTKKGKSSDTFRGKTEEEVLEIKYSEPFKLDCAVRTVKGEFVNLNVDPKDQFSWSMNDDLSLMRVLHYKIGVTEMIVVVKVLGTPELIPHITHRTENWKEYYMENSPVLTIKYRRAPKKILMNGTIHDQNAYTEIKLYENIEQRIFTIASEVYNGLETDDFRCKLVTKMNPKFADQWKEIF